MPQERPKVGDQIVSAEISGLEKATIAQFRTKWAIAFHSDPPAAFGPDLLRRSLAQHFQEKIFGALSRAARRELDRAVKAFDQKPTGRIEFPRRIKPSAVLVRHWKGSTHRVMVLDKGYAYEGETYSSLSQIACETTGCPYRKLDPDILMVEST
jgi:hypothetical protein